MTRRHAFVFAMVLALVPLAASARKAKVKAKPAPAAVEPKAAASPEPDDKTKAKVHFQAGAAFYRESRYDDAIREFNDAYSYDHNPALLFNIAQAHEKAGRIPEALRYYSRYVHDAPKAADRTTVEISIKNLEARLAEQGVQQVAIYSDPADASAAVDGMVLGPTPITADLKPGKHHLSVSLKDHKTVERDFGLYAGRSLDIDVTLEAGHGTVTAAPTGDLALFKLLPPPEEETHHKSKVSRNAERAARTKAPPPPETAWQRLRWPGLVAAGAGVVLLAVGTASQFSRMGLEQQAAIEPVQTKYAALSSQAHGAVTVSRVSFVAGGIAAAGGGALIAFDLGLLDKLLPHAR